MSKEEILLEAFGEIAKEVIDFIGVSSEHYVNRSKYQDNINEICLDSVKKLSNLPVIIDCSLRNSFLIDSTFIDSRINLTMVVEKNIGDLTHCPICYYGTSRLSCPNCDCGPDHYHFKLKK